MEPPGNLYAFLIVEWIDSESSFRFWSDWCSARSAWPASTCSESSESRWVTKCLLTTLATCSTGRCIVGFIKFRREQERFPVLIYMTRLLEYISWGSWLQREIAGERRVFFSLWKFPFKYHTLFIFGLGFFNTKCWNQRCSRCSVQRRDPCGHPMGVHHTCIHGI
jgi:hypothetical protein